MSQSELAKELGIPQSTYAGYEIGKRKIDLDLIRRLADFFAIPLAFLAIGEDVQNYQTQKKQRRQYTQNEELLIKKNRALDERGRKIIDKIIDIHVQVLHEGNEDLGNY